MNTNRPVQRTGKIYSNEYRTRNGFNIYLIMSIFTQILYQTGFTTKKHELTLNDSGQEKLYKYIWRILKNKKCHLYKIGGVSGSEITYLIKRKMFFLISRGGKRNMESMLVQSWQKTIE